MSTQPAQAKRTGVRMKVGDKVKMTTAFEQAEDAIAKATGETE